jgi:hypothetical protein
MFRFEATVRHCPWWRARSLDMTICVAPQHRLIGRALYSHLRDAIHTAARRLDRNDVEFTYDSVRESAVARMGAAQSGMAIRMRATDFASLTSGATSANPRLRESCLAIPLIIQDYRPLHEARGFFVPSMLFAPFRPRTSHVMDFRSVLPDRTSPKRVQKIRNGRAQSCPHRVERKTARRMQTHESLLCLRQWLSARRCS